MRGSRPLQVAELFSNDTMPVMAEIKQPYRIKAERQAAVPHIWYEWTMLLSTCGFLRKYHSESERNALDKGAYSAVLESFVVHFRNLYEFLFYGGEKGTYVRAADFFDSDTTFVALFALKSKILSDWIEEASVQVEHITYGRNWLTPNERMWPFIEITAAMVAPFRQFLAVGNFDGKESILADFDKTVAAFGFPQPIHSPGISELLENLVRSGVSITAATTANTPTIGTNIRKAD
jgi:hypothetical protein